MGSRKPIPAACLGLLVLASVGLGACASAPAGSSEPLPRAQLLTAQGTTVYAVLRELRPAWLRRTVDNPLAILRRAGEPPPPPDARMCTVLAFIGDEAADADDLRRMPVMRVLEVRLIPARAVRPNGSRCSHDRPTIHVILLEG